MSDSESPKSSSGFVCWVLVIATIAAGVACYFQLDEVKRVELELMNLNAKLPAITAFMLNHAWWLLTIIPVAIVLLLLYVVFTASSAIFRVGVAAAACMLICAIAGLAYVATTHHLAELQQRLH